jgi:hypothetical protein
MNIINPHIPVQTVSGHDVLLCAERHPKTLNLLGWIILPDQKPVPAQWLQNGKHLSSEADWKEEDNYDIKNVEGYEVSELFFNVYEDGSTGYGYPSEETARKYIARDSRLECVKTINQTITWKS